MPQKEKNSASANSVLRLVENMPHNQNFKLYFDNWFSSEALLVKLSNMGFQVVATVRPNRLSMDFKIIRQKFEKGERGDFDLYQHKEYTNILVVRWLDNKAVHLISNFVGVEPLGKINRWSKDHKARIDVPCPAIVKSYNKSMGGVDLSDMYHAIYRIERKSTRYYMRIIYYLFFVCITNAWLIMKEYTGENMILREFILSVSSSLMKAGKTSFVNLAKKRGRKPSVDIHEPEMPLKKFHRPNQQAAPDDIRYDCIDHWPLICEDRLKCMNNCKNLSYFKCEKCNVHLCANSKRNCFKNYHIWS